MSYNVVPTVATGDSWSASQHNTYIRDNFAAVWPYTTAGDLAYASSSTVLARLGKPGTAADYYLHASSAANPAWVLGSQIAGVLHAIGTVDWSPGSPQTFAGTWADITGATKTLTLAAGDTYRLVIMAAVIGYNATDGRGLTVRAMIAGSADGSPTPLNGGSTASPRNEALPYIYTVGGVSSGSVVCKLQCASDSGNPNYVSGGRLIAAAFAE